MIELKSFSPDQAHSGNTTHSLSLISTDRKSVLNMIAHEFRTPMTGLLGFLQLLESESNLSEDAQEFILHARRSAKTLYGLIDSILQMASLDAGVFENCPRYMSIRTVLQPIIEPYQIAAESKNLNLKISWPKTDQVFVDKDMLFTIVRNLLDNAVKFTSKGGIILKFVVSKTTLNVIVSDTGIGVDKDSLPDVFTRFWQESHGANRKYGGVGIGLSLVKGCVEAMKGQIHIDGRKNEGTNIQIDIPMISNGDDTDTVNFSKSTRILVVEDDPIIRWLVKKILHNYPVDTCRCAEDALEQVKSVTYDAFILDIQLGKGMSGLLLCKRLRDMSEYTKTPIVAMTAMNFDELTGSKLNLFSHHLPKPFIRDELIALIRQIVKKGNGGIEPLDAVH